MRLIKNLTTACAMVVALSAAIAHAAAPTRDDIEKRYAGAVPKEWGEHLPGIVRTLGTKDDVVALTLDLCGSATDSFDRDLAQFLVDSDIPATFFVNSRWIKKHPDEMAWLASVPIFELEGHGLRHVPASMNGRSIYKIAGTKDAAELSDEVVKNADDIERVTGVRPRFYRSGTAYYDEHAVALMRDLGVLPLGFSILGDAGATYSEEKIFSVVSQATSGDIIIAHANHPEKATGRGLKRVLPVLRSKGLRFVKLSEYL